MGTATTADYRVTGMTCGHCVGAVTEEIAALSGVTGVSVDLVAGGTSTVTITSATPLTADQVAAALEEAGNYHLATD
jgi:copper chaperone